MTWPETRASGTTSSLFSPRRSLSSPSYCRSWSWSSFSAPRSPLSPPWTAVPPRSVRARSSFWTNSSRTSIGSAVSISHQKGARTRDLGKFLTASPLPCPLLLPSQLRPSASPKRRCSKNENTHEESFQGFPALPSDVPWDSESVWSTFAFYLLSLHIPLSFGGLSVVAHVLHRPILDPQTEALSLFGIQVFEFFGTLCLLKSTAKPQFKLISLFKGNRLSNGTKTWMASALGFCSLIFLVFLTSFLADRVIGPKAVNNLILKEILLSSDISRAACVLVYCIITPLMEEIVYRGFLLTSISSTSKWQQAVLLSSAIFSAVHFSGENSLQLFVIGCVLGCSYCWSGDLSTSFLIHSLYNALILVITYAS